MSALTTDPSPLTTLRPRSVALNILAFAAAIALLRFGRIFLITVVIAMMIAFLLEPVVRFFVKLRIPRGLSSFLVCSIAILIVYLIGLGLVTEASYLVEDLPTYSQRVSDLL